MDRPRVPDRRVTGRVVDRDGAPVPGALVTFATPIPFPEIAVRTDADGRFAIALPRAPFTLTAHAAGRHSEPLPLPPDADHAPPIAL